MTLDFPRAPGAYHIALLADSPMATELFFDQNYQGQFGGSELKEPEKLKEQEKQEEQEEQEERPTKMQKTSAEEPVVEESVASEPVASEPVVEESVASERLTLRQRVQDEENELVLQTVNGDWRAVLELIKVSKFGVQVRHLLRVILRLHCNCHHNYHSEGLDQVIGALGALGRIQAIDLYASGCDEKCGMCLMKMFRCLDS